MINKAVYALVILFTWTTLSGQEAVINSDFEKLIEKLSKSYNIKIAYSAELIKTEVAFQEEQLDEGTSLSEILDKALSSNGISYRIVDGDKVLLRKDALPEYYQEKSRLITGEIIDRKTGFPLPYASITFDDNLSGTMSDIDGRFSLRIEENSDDKIAISYLGYKPKSLKCNGLKDHNKITLIQQEELLDEVTIIVDPVAVSEIGKNNKIKINNDRLIKITASDLYGTDLIRTLQMLPGVSNDADAAGELKLRGSDADETLIMIDGIPIYKADHYYGIFSSINPYYINEVTLYKNKIPLEYENKSGGMLMLTSSDDITKMKGTFEADFLKLNGFLELPISSSIDLIIGGRFNHTDPFNSPLSTQSQDLDLDNALIDNLNFQRSKLLETKPAFKFWDINLKAKVELSPKLQFSISALGSNDMYDREYLNSFLVRRMGKEAFIEESYINTEEWKNNGLNIYGKYSFNEQKSLRWSLYNSDYETYYQLGMGISLKNRNQEREIFDYSSSNFNKIRSGGLRLEYDHEDNWHFGLNIQQRENEILFREQEKTFFARDQQSGELAIFGKKDIFIGDDIKVGVGARFNYAESIDTLNFSPLAEIRYSPDDNYYLKSSYARLYQNFRELSFESRFGHYQQYFVLAEEDLYPQGVSNLYMVGGGLKVGNWNADIELFYKNINGAIGFLPSKPGLNSKDIIPNIQSLYRLYIGETKSKGIDVYLGYDIDNFYSQIAYTYSKTEDKFSEIFRGEPFPSQNDRRHQLKWLNAININDITFSIGTIYNSGKPYIAFDLLEEVVTRKGIDLDKALLKLPHYFRLDLSARYDFNFRNTNFYIKGSVYNLTDRENVEYYQQTFAIPISADQDDNIIIGSESGLVERLFNISAGVSF